MATAAAVLAQVAALNADRRGARESLVFGAATALTAVHTTLDAFLVPEEGTGWNDHLLAGSVSLAILALAAYS